MEEFVMKKKLEFEAGRYEMHRVEKSCAPNVLTDLTEIQLLTKAEDTQWRLERIYLILLTPQSSQSRNRKQSE